MDEHKIFNSEYIRQIKNAANLSDIIQDAIKEAIVTGKLAPGLKLKQIELANQLEVSQQTIREALKQLAYTGWVIQKPNRGFAVSDISFKEQEEIMEIRSALEVYAFEKAVGKVTATDLARMRALLPMTDYSGSFKLADQKTVNANAEFHMIPIRALNNNNLTQIMENIWGRLWVYHVRNQSDENYKASAIHDFGEHKKILEAFEVRDAEQVRKAITDHVVSTKVTLLHLRDVMRPMGHK